MGALCRSFACLDQSALLAVELWLLMPALADQSSAFMIPVSPVLLLTLLKTRNALS